ncbi:MAG: hypothetical protein ACI8RD_002587 [Bacillariaceae sp.]|jgi:hypothetical protein
MHARDWRFGILHETTQSKKCYFGFYNSKHSNISNNKHNTLHVIAHSFENCQTQNKTRQRDQGNKIGWDIKRRGDRPIIFFT